MRLAYVFPSMVTTLRSQASSEVPLSRTAGVYWSPAASLIRLVLRSSASMSVESRSVKTSVRQRQCSVPERLPGARWSTPV